VGAPCNICDPSEKYARIFRVNLDGSGVEAVVFGMRNTVGVDWHPRT
jgi:glucose/arabinose dehydrogenase